MSSNTVKVEPPPDDESWLDRLTREDKLEALVNFLFFLITLSVFIVIVVCALCYFARQKTPRR